MPIPKFDQRLNKIFELDDDVQIAKLAGKDDVVRTKLSEGLSVSCLLWKDINGDPVVLEAKAENETWLKLVEMRQHGRLSEFLEIERRALRITKLEQRVVDTILVHMQMTIDAIIEHRGPLPREWRNVTIMLETIVCREASEIARGAERQPVLKSAFLAAGGAFVALLNLIPVPEMNLSPADRALSSSVGVWMIDHAAGGILDRFFGI
jgi:hypothetical protein